MSSTSSVCSSNDAEFIIDTRIPTAIRRDIDRFSVFINRLRAALDVNVSLADGESMCVNVHAALEMVSESMRDLFKHPQFKTNALIVHSLQLVQSVKDLKFDTCSVDTSHVFAVIDHLESTVLNTILTRHVPSVTSSQRSTSLLRRSKPASTESFNVPSTRGSAAASLQRRHSTFFSDVDDSKEENLMEIDKLLIARPDGVEIAFERAKAWSIYCKDVAAYVRGRIQLEQEHARRVRLLVESARRDFNKPFMPLRDIFERSFDTEEEVMCNTKDTTEHLMDRVVEALESRRKEHESTRKTLAEEWAKAAKALNDSEEAYDKAKMALRLREESLRKARDSCMRTESSPPEREASRRRRDIEKRNRAVETAALKKEDAERNVAATTAELRRRRREIDKAKENVIERLRELIFQCEQTTKACAAHYFKSLATLWVRLPGSFHELSDATREYQPGAEYMAFLHTLPTRAASSSSLIRSDRSVDEGVASCDGSTSLTSLRRNALNPDDESVLPDTKRHKKTSYAGRIFDCELSLAAQSHKLQRTMQPSKCAACETLSILYTVQCTKCGYQWHKACFPRITAACGQTPRVVDRRTSIFGVALTKYLEAEHRSVPLILERSVDQLQRRGLLVKGIYRTCGVKSKIEEICEAFERSSVEDQVSLDHVHPMNLASVVKLYLRKLPEPLLTYELYHDFVRVGTSCTTKTNEDEDPVEELKTLLRRLPPCNYETLKFLLLHLNRVSWFQDTNLMGASNLSTVITPSLIWTPPTDVDHAAAIVHTQYTNKCVEVMIRNAYNLFAVDRQTDWQTFFGRYSVEEPPKIEVPGDESDVEDGDELDEELDDEDDEDQMFLPPTPDILKNTRKPAQPNSCIPVVKATVERTHSARRSDESPIQARPAESRRRLASEKTSQPRRSYTTSIVITPLESSSTTREDFDNDDEEDEEDDEDAGVDTADHRHHHLNHIGHRHVFDDYADQFHNENDVTSKKVESTRL